MVPENKLEVWISLVLDASGSMAPTQEATLSTVNEFIQAQRQAARSENAIGKFTLTTFDTTSRIVINNQDIETIREISSRDYAPSGTTALEDAVCKTIIALKKSFDRASKKPRVVICIMTDGRENASIEYKGKMREMVERSKDFAFVFLGADKDAIETAANYGIQRSNAARYSQTTEGQSIVAKSLGTIARSSFIPATDLNSLVSSNLILDKDGQVVEEKPSIISGD